MKDGFRLAGHPVSKLKASWCDTRPMSNRHKSSLLTAALAVFWLALNAAPGWCDDDHGGEQEGSRQAEHHDHDEARDLVTRGNIRPLPEVLRAVQLYVPGEVIDVRLRSKDLRWIYMCKLVTPAGRRVVVAIDAASLAILEGEREE